MVFIVYSNDPNCSNRLTAYRLSSIFFVRCLMMSTKKQTTQIQFMNLSQLTQQSFIIQIEMNAMNYRKRKFPLC